MTSVLTAPPSDIISSLPAAPISPRVPIMTQVQGPTPPQHIKPEEEERRGRARSRSESKNDDQDHTGDGDIKDGDNSSTEDGPSRKRRRSRKGLDKKFECPTEGCGKSYSRAEHLYRHQLNHSPKQIYRCDFPDCNRTFVRLDLCNRHKDRHTAKGSALSRRDSIMSQSSPVDGVRPPYGTLDPVSPETNRPGTAYNGKVHAHHLQYQSPKDLHGSPYTPMTHTPPAGFPHGTHVNGAVNGFLQQENGYALSHGVQQSHQSPIGPTRPTVQTNTGPYGILSPVSTQHGGFPNPPANTPQSATALSFTNQQNFPAFALPPSDFPVTSPAAAVSRDAGHSYPASAPGDYPDQPQSHAQTPEEMMLIDQMTSSSAIFTADGSLNKSPYISIPEDFVAYLFNTSAPDSSPALSGHTIPPSQYGDYQSQYGGAYYGNEAVQLGYFPSSNQSQQIMSVTNILDRNSPESLLTEEKSQEIFNLIKERFHDNEDTPANRKGGGILDGDRTQDTHMLSRRMMQHYIGSYWLHFSDQVPILHRPTFSPERTPNLLLLAMMAIGAACLERTYGTEMIKAGAQLSNFLAWHLRWEIFMDSSFSPPAKLWVFQALILLELYEKMYSTRELHERAHIHHSSMITTMRRGRALIGKTALDSPSARDDRGGSRQSSSSVPAHTPDEWWNTWIVCESTRRTAFAAFLVDSVHATMFGHSTVMVAHEMRLPLPCDERVWKATSGAEVNRIEAHLSSDGEKPISFLEGLKRTLSGHEVQTNPFGRQVLMAGLLSVSWHMHQRDLQISSLGNGMPQALGGRDKWRSTLTRAFDSWRTDFDKALQRNDGAPDPYSTDKRSDANIVFESRTVLHHLAHMAMHVDIVDCQIFARAKRLLGRSIGTSDLNSAQRRMRDGWAPSAKARDATFYALKFLRSVLLDDNVSTPHLEYNNLHGLRYFARDDVLLNRPWVLYFAALVVWCYGYALEGPSNRAPLPTTQEEKMSQMRAYLDKFGGVSSPEDLKHSRGVNNNSAMLMVLKDSFASTRWELLHEGASLLNNCIQLNIAQPV